MGLLAKLNGNPRTHTKTEKIRFRGVQVIVDEQNCCQAALAIADKRFLVEEIPKLPLADCDAAQCGCGYDRFDDRRKDSRRASDIGSDLASQLHGDNCRSSTSSGRRRKD